MEKLYKELDDVKVAMEMLRAENRTKTELSESLRKSHNEQLTKIKEAKLEIEKQAQELNAKAEEISDMKKMFEDAKSTLQEKELSLRQLRSVHDKLRAENGEKVQALEGKNAELISALDEAHTRIQNEDRKIHEFKEEIERTKSLLSVSQKKASEAEQKAQALKDLRQRDDLLMNLEEENVKIKDQLKWKKEQFKHLHEAHEKIQDQFRVSKKEWEHEKSTLIDEICSLQTKLDSQIRISESLQNKLQICNQALAHEESRRKLLEVQVSESKACYENVFAECQEAKSKIEILSVKRDDEIAMLRNSLGTKDTLFKEAEYRREYLEQENQELRTSLKEFQEAQIKKSGSVSSLTKLRNKLRSLEQVHKDCSEKLIARETEWSTQMEIIMGDLTNCRSELDSKDRKIQELQIELENCYSSVMQLKLQNEEINVMLTVYQSGVSDAHSNFSKPEVEMKLHIKEAEEKIALLTEQLDKKNNAMVKAHAEIEEERRIAASLMDKIELLDPLEQKYMLTLKELENCKEMLEESFVQQLRLKEQSLQVENSLKEDLRKVSDAFEEASFELAQIKKSEVSSLTKLQNKLSSLEQVHKDCSEKFNARETEWSSLMETMMEDLNNCRSMLDSKDRKIQEVQTELENCYSSVMQLKLQNEEINVMLTLYQSGLSDAYSNFSEPEVEPELRIKEAEEKITLLTEQLDKKNTAMFKAHAEIEQERRIAVSLMGRVELLDSLEQKHMLTLKELEKCKEMLEESHVQQLRLNEQYLQMENALKEDIRQISDAFDDVSCELAERMQEESEIEFELDRWKSAAEHLQRCLDENQEFRREMEGSLLAQVETEQTLKQEKDHLLHLVEEKDRKADDLQQLIVSLKQEHLRRETEISTSAKMVSQNEFEQEKENLLHIIDEKQNDIDNLEKRIDWMEHESMRRELDAMRRELEAVIIVQIETEKSMEQEKERLLQVLEEKDCIIEHLRLQTLEDDINMKKKQTVMDTLHEAWEKVLTTQVFAELETQVKSTIIIELEEEITSLRQKLEFQEESMICLNHQVEQLEAALESKQLEKETVMIQLGNKLRVSETSVEKLDSENRSLLSVIEEFSEQLDGFSHQDRELMNIMGRMVENFEAEDELSKGTKGCFEYYESRENEPFSFSRKNTEAIPDRRSPLIERNS